MDDNLKVNESNQGPKGLGYRHLMTFLLFFATFVAYSMRSNMSIGIVAMTDVNNTKDNVETFDWSSQTQDTILSSFFWGYLVLQVPSGLIAQVIGARLLLFVGILVSSVATLLTPVAASSGGWGAVCALRVITGISQGALFPSVHSALSRWAPPSEQGQMASLAFIGSQVGTIATLAVGGVLGDSLGWPSIFYVVGSIGLLWSIIWFFFAASSPAESKYISEQEKNYILQSIGTKVTKTSLKTPWLAMLFSVPMWALLLTYCVQSWGFWILMTEMPVYMSNILKFNLKDNGLLSALPYLVMCILGVIFGLISDLIRRKNLVRLSYSRKIFNSIGFWGPTIALACLGLLPNVQPPLAVTLLVLSVGLNAGSYVSFQINHIDLSPNFASTMMGITNGLATIFALIGPLVVSVVVKDKESVSQWRVVFWSAALVYGLGNFIFLIMGSADVQPWNDPDYKRKKNSNENETNNDVES